MKKNFALILLAGASIVFVQCSTSGEHNYSGSKEYMEEATEDEGYNPGYHEMVQNQVISPDFQQDIQSEEYAQVEENNFLSAITQPKSTFSIDVDNASYTNVRRIIQSNQLPTPNAVRIEEMINYFDYNYKAAPKELPFSINSEVAQSPWNPSNRLVRIGLQGTEVSMDEMPSNNLVFLIDVSGSMAHHNKLPMLKRAFNQMVDNLGEEDYVSIVTYAGNTEVYMAPTSCDYKDFIKEKMDALYPQGGTNGASGIQLAYAQAEQNLLKEGNNRILLATDGDFNIGMVDQEQLVSMIERKREKGIDLTVLGVGMGNIKDSRMEAFANNGNGNYFYIDSDHEAQNILVDNLAGTLLTIAKDVKIQVEFNPAKVKEYRLIGYENRALANKDFTNDAKDAGELGAGHNVTAIYEVTPFTSPNVNEELKYQTTVISEEAFTTSEICTVKLRFKHPKGDESKEIVAVIHDSDKAFDHASKDLQLAACVGGFGMLLKKSEHKGNLSFAQLEMLTYSAINQENEKEQELLQLIKRAGALNTLTALNQ